MVTKVKKERAEVIALHGRKCAMCGAGPLQRRALHIVPAGVIDGDPAPVCRECRDLTQGDLHKNLYDAMKRHAKAFDRLVDMGLRVGLKRYPARPKGIEGI